MFEKLSNSSLCLTHIATLVSMMAIVNPWSLYFRNVF